MPIPFTYWDLGQQKRGAVVRVTLSGNAANVRLFDSSNFQSFKNGRNARGIGGLVRRSPVDVEIPRNGHWYLVIDYGGRAGRGRASFEIVPPPLPEFRGSRGGPLGAIADAVEQARGDEIEPAYDVFIAHATEDKDELVRPLAHALRARDLDVWYDEFEFKLGSSIRRGIDHGIANSRFGIVVLSPSFFAKSWPQYELDGLVTMAVSGKQVILPLWHNISADEVMRASPSLADKIALRTADLTVDEIAEKVADAIGLSG